MSILLAKYSDNVTRCQIQKQMRLKWHNNIHRCTGRVGCTIPCQKKSSIIRAKLMYRLGKDNKNILLFNVLMYLFSSCNSPNLVTDLSNGYVLSLTPWFCILERLISIY